MQQTRSTYLDEVNARIKQLEAENSFLAKVVETKVINKRTGTVRRVKTLHEINESRREACISRYWQRIPRSNSNSFVFHTIQNLPSSTIDDREPILLSRQLIKG